MKCVNAQFVFWKEIFSIPPPPPHLCGGLGGIRGCLAQCVSNQAINILLYIIFLYNIGSISNMPCYIFREGNVFSS